MKEKTTERSLVDIHTLVIGEYTYKVRLADGLVALRGAAILANVVSPMFAGLSGMSTAKGAFARAITYFFQSPDLGDNVEKLVHLFAPTTQVVTGGGKRSMSLEDGVGAHFAGKLDAMMKWLVFCLKINLASFLDEIPGLLAGEDVGGLLESFGLSAPKDAEKSGGSGE
jgi:hypothetical protein